MELEDLAAGGGVAAGDGNDPLAQQTGNVPIPGSRRQKVAARLCEADAARARQRALGPPDAEALHAELVHHLTHQLDGTVRPVNHRHFWDKQAHEQRISRERFCLDRSGGIAHDSCDMRNLCKALDEARREQWLWSRGVHEKQIGTSLEYRSPEYLALKKAEKEWKASPRLVPTYFPRPSGDELEAQWMEWHGLEPPSGGYDRPPEVANADVGGMGDWELAGVGGVGEWELAGA